MKINAWIVAFLLAGLLNVQAADKPIKEEVGTSLVKWNGKKLEKVDPATLDPVKYYAIYYSAAWCPPCHRFTPELVSWYNKIKPSHPEFELIFVSQDNSEQEQEGYIKEMSMPWPVVKFSKIQHNQNTFAGPGISRFAGDEIPDLVLVNSDGKVLADSFANGDYVGPQSVMQKAEQILGAGKGPM